MVRRLSTSTTNKKQTRPTRNELPTWSEKGKEVTTEGEVATSSGKPASSSIADADFNTWARLRRATSFRSRRSAISCASGTEVARCDDLRTLAPPGTIREPVMPFFERPGKAARAAAAAHNANNERMAFVSTMLGRKDTKTYGQHPAKAVVKDSDSAVCADDYGEGTNVQRTGMCSSTFVFFLASLPAFILVTQLATLLQLLWLAFVISLLLYDPGRVLLGSNSYTRSKDSLWKNTRHHQKHSLIRIIQRTQWPTRS